MLDITEKTILQFLDLGYGAEQIEEILAIDVSFVIANLIDKEVIREDFSYRSNTFEG